jgi:hypothetical protein
MSMSTLSQAGWVVHDVGLATSIGGSLFGKTALEPALDRVVSDTREHEQISEKAWTRFSWLNLAAHAAFAIPWIVGRRMLSGREVSRRARRLTRVKDVLVGAGLITGVATIALGKLLHKRMREQEAPIEERIEGIVEGVEEHKPVALERAVKATSTLNLLAVLGIAAVTKLLAMEGSRSFRFPLFARRLP